MAAFSGNLLYLRCWGGCSPEGAVCRQWPLLRAVVNTGSGRVSSVDN